MSENNGKTFNDSFNVSHAFVLYIVVCITVNKLELKVYYIFYNLSTHIASQLSLDFKMYTNISHKIRRSIKL